MMAYTPGLLSVTFRRRAPSEIIKLARDVHLAAIGWSGDVHVPHGDLKTAQEVGRTSRRAGLRVVSYDSYYRFDDVGLSTRGRGAGPAGPIPPFEAVLATARVLEAPAVRIWAGTLGSDVCSREDRKRIVAHTRAIADQAAEHNIAVVFEYHDGTLTDTPESAVRLMKEVHHPNVGVLWQPRHTRSVEENVRALRMVRPWLRGLHLFHWGDGGYADRRPLRDGSAAVSAYLREGEADRGREAVDPAPSRPALLEFVRDDDPRAFQEDVATLRELTDNGS